MTDMVWNERELKITAHEYAYRKSTTVFVIVREASEWRWYVRAIPADNPLKRVPLYSMNEPTTSERHNWKTLEEAKEEVMAWIVKALMDGRLVQE